MSRIASTSTNADSLIGLPNTYLQVAVPGCLAGMRAQEITQVDVITMRLATRHHEIQVVIDGIGRRQERLPSLDAQISLMPPPSGGQHLDRRCSQRRTVFSWQPTRAAIAGTARPSQLSTMIRARSLQSAGACRVPASLRIFLASLSSYGGHHSVSGQSPA